MGLLGCVYETASFLDEMETLAEPGYSVKFRSRCLLMVSLMVVFEHGRELGSRMGTASRDVTQCISSEQANGVFCRTEVEKGKEYCEVITRGNRLGEVHARASCD